MAKFDKIAVLNKIGSTGMVRCIHTSELEAFVKKAKECNKRVYYDVADLVIDTCYTDKIPSLSALSREERYAMMKMYFPVRKC